jgi:hypothetical protein
MPFAADAQTPLRFARFVSSPNLHALQSYTCSFALAQIADPADTKRAFQASSPKTQAVLRGGLFLFAGLPLAKRSRVAYLSHASRS